MKSTNDMWWHWGGDVSKIKTYNYMVHLFVHSWILTINVRI